MSQLAQYLAHLQRFGIRPGLERIRALLARAGDPQLNYPVLLVGGTNGKGSTAEFAARMLATDGRKVGLYTSPHLYEWNERLRILPGRPTLFEGSISDEELDELFAEARPHIHAVATELGQPTEFEVVTFLGLWHFSRQKVDAAVVEVGLGGRWDATNVTEPLVSVITHVALDHCDRLGNTVEEIGLDKVHIARPGRPLITAEARRSVLRVFEKYCQSVGAELRRVDVSGATTFQEINCRLAAAATAEFATTVGWPWPPAEPAELTLATVPGRAEEIGQNPRVIVDGANNPDGAAVLAKHIRKTLKIPRKDLILVLGILADKDWQGMARILVPLAKRVIVTQSQSARALPAEELLDFVAALGVPVELVMEVPVAAARARELAAEHETVLITGSFTTIAEVPR